MSSHAVPDSAPTDVAPAKRPRTDVHPSEAVSALSTGPFGIAGPAMPPVGAQVSGKAVYTVMREVVPWVSGKLREVLVSISSARAAFRDVPPWQHTPLQMTRERPDDDIMVSYRAAWEIREAQTALTSTGIYEAAVNVLWLNPFHLNETARTILGDTPQWSHIQDIVKLHFARAASRGEPRAPSMLVFPITLPVHIGSNAAATSTSCFEGSLPVVSGHTYVFAWFVAMFEAMRDDDVARTAALWRCGLTVLVQVRVDLSAQALAIWYMQISESQKTTNLCVGDVVPAVVLKAFLLGETQGSDVEHLKPSGVTVAMFQDCLSHQSVSVLDKMARRHGRDAFGGDGEKLAHVLWLCSEVAKVRGEQPAALVLYVLEGLEFALRMRLLDVSDVTVTNLCGASNDGVGHVLFLLARRSIVAHVQCCLDDLGLAHEVPWMVPDLATIMHHFASYPMYERAFDITWSPTASWGHPDFNYGPVEKFIKTKCLKPQVSMVVECLYNVLLGVHDNQLEELIKRNSSTLRDIKWANMEVGTLTALFRYMKLHRVGADYTKILDLPAESRRLWSDVDEGHAVADTPPHDYVERSQASHDSDQ